MNIVDWIVTLVLLAPLIYGAFWYYRRISPNGVIADQIVSNLSESSRVAANVKAERNSAHS